MGDVAGEDDSERGRQRCGEQARWGLRMKQGTGEGVRRRGEYNELRAVSSAPAKFQQEC